MNRLLLFIATGVFLCGCGKDNPPPDPTPAPEITDSTLIAFYKFDNSTKDETKYANNGTANGNITFVSDRKGVTNSALFCNGSNSFIQIPSSVSLESPRTGITIAAWIKAEDISTKGVFFLCKSNSGQLDPFQYRAGLKADYGLFFGFKNGVTSTYDVQGPNYFLWQDQWKHITYTYNSSVAKFFINGNKIGEIPYQGNMLADNKPLEIGRDAHGPIEYFKGTLDDIKIYNRALSETEVNNLVANQNK